MAYVDTCQIFSPAQTASLRKGGEILRDCLQFTASLVRPGISTWELDQAAENFILERGGVPAFKGYGDFPATLCTSVNDSIVHGIPNRKEILREGDIISIDCGVIMDGLYTDACVSVGVGAITPDAEVFMRITSEVLESVLKEKVKAGVRVGDISAFIEKGLKKAGYTPVKTLTGHGLGDNLHQFPDVPNVGKEGTGPILPAGTMIAIEPIAVMGSGQCYTTNDNWTVKTSDGSLACHFEHSVLLTEDGYELIA